jgi:hypothetical protein
VYNPFSLLLLFDTRDFRNYWFESGTPTFLIQLIRQQHYEVQALEQLQVNELAFGSYEVERLDVVPLLFQTGYLTIKGYDPQRRLYTLSYPNFEVEESFLQYLVGEFSAVGKEQADAYGWRLLDALREADFGEFFAVLQVFFAGIPYDIQLSQERYYQTVFYLIFKLLRLQLGMEGGVPISHSPISHLPAGLVALAEGVFVFEFKVGGTAAAALAQIVTRGYVEPYRQGGKPIYSIGVVFGQEERGIVDWQVVESA